MGVINEDLRPIKALVFDVDGVLSATVVPMDQDGVPMRTVNIKDGYALHQARQKGVRIGILSGADTPAVRNRFMALGLEPQDVVLGASRKLDRFLEMARGWNLDPSEILYVGDDIPDLEVLEASGLPCCPRDAAWEVKRVAHYISPFDGGYGVGRDILEQYLRVHGLWLDSADAFGW